MVMTGMSVILKLSHSEEPSSTTDKQLMHSRNLVKVLFTCWEEITHGEDDGNGKTGDF